MNIAKKVLMIATLSLLVPIAIPATPAVAADPVEIKIVEIIHSPKPLYTYQPPLAEIAPGTTVTWTNTGVLYHTVTVTAQTTGDTIDVGLEPGESFSYTFENSGVFLYHCVPHELPQNGNARGGVIVA